MKPMIPKDKKIKSTLKPSKPFISAVKKANMALGMIKRQVSRYKSTIVRLYKSLVRPTLEYCLQVWNSSLIKDIELLEQVQHRATKLIPEIDHLSYHDRLKYLNIPWSLEDIVKALMKHSKYLED